MGIWLLIVSYWTTNQKPFLVQILIYKNATIKRILREDEKKVPRRNSRLSKKHPFHSRPEVLWTTVRRYKISVSDFRDVSVTLTHLIITLPLPIFFLLLFSGKANIVCLLFIVTQTCFNKIDFLLLNNRFFLFFELLDNIATHITWLSKEDPAELCQTPSVDLSNTAWARKNLTKQTVGS